MNSMKRKFSITAMAAIILCAMTASASVIYDTDFDTLASSYSQNDSGGGPVYTFSYSGNTNGVGGSAALSLEFDASGVGAEDGYTLNMFSNQRLTGLLATSDNAADYTLEFDVSAVGLVSANQTLNLEVKFQGGTVNSTTSFTMTGTGFDHITINLADIGSGFPTLTAANINDSMQLKFFTWDGQGADKFGRDAGNGIFVDNVTLTAIPEPASLLLLLVAGGAFVVFRRKK